MSVPLFFQFQPRDVDPALFVDRSRQLRWLEGLVTHYLYNRTVDKGLVVAVLGAKGVGKSILSRKALGALRDKFGRYVAFVTIDCRRKLSQRKVLREIADSLHQELARMKTSGASEVTPELVDTAAVVKTIASYTHVKLSTLHENLAVFKNASNLKVGGKLLDFLRAEFNIAVSRDKQERQALEGEVLLDDTTLRESLIQLLRDVRIQDPKLDVIIYLDNIDELDHDACNDASKREQIRLETIGLLDLCRAPVGFVLNMRSYYASSLLRDVDNTYTLESLPPEHMAQMLQVRLAGEREEIREVLASDQWSATLEELSRMAPTPLVFLRWLKYLAEWDEVGRGPIATRLEGYNNHHVANVSPEQLRVVARIFDPPARTVQRAELLVACDGREAMLSQLIHAQVVLPRDFWEPNEFTLDPELHYMLIPSEGTP
ncbi:MAG: hypothetical protein AAGF11_28450 [Myxococcota bacterium]